jgi:2,4-dienoyl-CoA reductase-like NADH-dependent reductase (Old Yellow Enzyme family)
MTTRTADREGYVTEDMIAYYCARAEGGVGLITVEMASPERVGRHRKFELGIYDDRFLPGLKSLVEALHARGSKVSIQLGHGGGHTRTDICGEPPIAPSAVPHVVQEGTTETIIPQAMSKERIGRTVQAFADAAIRAQEAGFDMVEIHGAHGYLISQFLCPAENRRTDEYGGSLINRARIGNEIVRRIKLTAPKLGVIFRLSGDDMFPGGLPLQEAVEVAAMAVEAGADAIHVTGGHYRSLPSGAVMIPPMSMRDGAFLPYIEAVKERVRVPVIAVGRLGAPEKAMQVLDEGKADFIALGRPLLADPQWPNKVWLGATVRMCIACNTCVDGMRMGDRLHCLVNATTGRERTYRELSVPRGRSSGKRIAVVGGGPSGLTYASLIGQDHRVTLFERENCLGGAFLLAGHAPKFQGVTASLTSLERYVASMEQRCREAGVDIRLRTDATTDPELLKGFDIIVIATGAPYRWKVGALATKAIQSGLLRWPILRSIASHSRIRDWFYYTARKSDADRLIAHIETSVPVWVIGDAKRPGKSQKAIEEAFDAAIITQQLARA